MENFKCSYCGRDFSRKESLSRHINYSHLKILKNNSHHICRLCGEDMNKKIVVQHLRDKHNYDEENIFKYQYFYSRIDLQKIPLPIREEYLSKIYSYNKGKNVFPKQFISFYNLIISIRPFAYDDIINFLKNVLPWKLKNKKIGNSKELCNLIFPNEPENARILYEKNMRSVNPFTNHNGKYSPFSKKFIGYKGKSDEEIKDLVYKAGRYDKIGRNVNQKEYWMKRGFSEQDAILKVKEHVNVFSLEKCIEKYGKEKGYERWKQRQEKWQKTLNSKPIEEINRINHNKVYKNGPKSGIELRFLNSIIPDESHHNIYLKEYCVVVDLLYGRKIIEFYGDYWHCNPREKRFTPDYYHPYLKMTAAEKWEFDDQRIDRLVRAGYEVKIVWEMDYKNNKEKIIKECKEFLGV